MTWRHAYTKMNMQRDCVHTKQTSNKVWFILAIYRSLYFTLYGNGRENCGEKYEKKAARQ